MPKYAYDTANTVYETATYDPPPGTPLVELYINGAWVDITAFVRTGSSITIRRGRQDEQEAFAGAQCGLTLDNRDGRFSRKYTLGAYYPNLLKVTPLRVSVYKDDGTTTVRFWGVVSEWPPYWSADFNEGYVSIIADGPRRRASRDGALRSAFTRGVLARSNVIGYWPVEDGNNSTSVQPLVGALPGVATSVSFAASDIFDGSDAIAELSEDGSNLQFPVPAYAPAAGGQQARWLMQCTGTGMEAVDVRVDTSGAHYFILEYVPGTNTAGFAMFNYATGLQEYTSGPVGPWSGAFSGRTFAYIKLKQNGTAIDYTFGGYELNDPTGQSYSDSITSSTLGVITQVTVSNNGGSDIVVGQMAVENQQTSIFDMGGTGGNPGPLGGYAGETAGARVARLAAETGNTLTVVGTGGTVLGPQTPESFLQLVDECAAADDGISTESVTTFGFSFRARDHFYGQSADFQVGITKAQDLQAVDDDQLVQNDVTVSRVGGSSARVVSTDPLFAPSAIGTYDAGYTLNLGQDSDLPYQAQWRLAEGTVDSPRVSSMTFDALGLSSITRNALIALREGDRFALTQAISVLPLFGFEVAQNLRVEGWTETITPTRWVFDLHAVPWHPYDVLILDDAVYGILDTYRLAL